MGWEVMGVAMASPVGMGMAMVVEAMAWAAGDMAAEAAAWGVGMATAPREAAKAGPLEAVVSSWPHGTHDTSPSCLKEKA